MHDSSHALSVLLSRAGLAPGRDEIDRLEAQLALTTEQSALVHSVEAARYAEPALVHRALVHQARVATPGER